VLSQIPSQPPSIHHNNMPSFAQKEMARYGWSEGKGLGRTENGMKNAIKVKLKNNTMGLGHDQGAEFSFHWWDHIFNKAASSFKVNESEEGVVMEKCEGKKITPLLISTKRGLPTRLANKSLLYGTFVKAGTYDANKVQETNVALESGSEDSSDSDDDDHDDDVEGDKKGLINDTLHKMFLKTGLTGHKAARHGHNLNGKLQRLMAQEERELPKPPLCTEQTENINCGVSEKKEMEEQVERNCDGTDVLECKTKKKKKISVPKEIDEPPSVETDLNVSSKKKKKKKTKSTDNDLNNDLVVSPVLEKVSSDITKVSSKVKKRKHKLDEKNTALLTEQPKKKKKKKETN